MNKDKNKLPIYAEERIDDLIEQLTHTVQDNQRPANEVILVEEEAMSKLKICKYSLASLRSEGLIGLS